MSIRKSCVLLASGGGPSPGRKRSHGGDKRAGTSYFTENAFRQMFGGERAKPHKAGYVGVGQYLTRTTQAYFRHRLPLFWTTSFVQHGDITKDIPQVTENHFVPLLSKQEYEEWKVANSEAVKQHAGRYAVVQWSLGEKGEKGTGGITHSLSRQEYLTGSVPQSPETWVDYIAPNFGTVDTYDAEEDARWNYKGFPDVDELKDWLNFEDRRSHSLAPNSTPVSRALKKGELRVAELEQKPALQRPGMDKFLTYNSYYAYGTEQFSPWFSGHVHNINQVDGEGSYVPNNRYMNTFGLVRRFIPDTLYMTPDMRHGGKLFDCLKDLTGSRFQVTEAHPTLRYVRIREVPDDILQSLSLQRATNMKRGKKMLYLGTSHSNGFSYHPDSRTFQHRLTARRSHHSRRKPTIPLRRKKLVSEDE